MNQNTTKPLVYPTLTDDCLDRLIRRYDRMVMCNQADTDEHQVRLALHELKELRADAPQIISVEIDYPINSMTDGGK
jgi:hypothetical protein